MPPKKTARTSSAPPASKAARPLPDLSATPRYTRDRIFGIGAVTCAVLAVASLSLPSIALLFGLYNAALAFLRPGERRDANLALAGWGLTAWILLQAALLPAWAAASLYGGTDIGALPFDSQALADALVALTVASGVALTVAAAFAALSFHRKGEARYGLLSRSGLCVVIHYVLSLPLTVSMSSAAPGLGRFWFDPITYGNAALGIAAGLIIWSAFAWRTDARDGDAPLRHSERDYLLFAAAALLLLPSIQDLALADWSVLSPAVGETATQAGVRAVFDIAGALLIPALLISASAGFFVSCRQEGWSPARWSTLTVEPAQPTAPETEAMPRPSWSHRVLLTWRLPLLASWLLLMIAACAGLGYYGFLAAAPAAVHYLMMLQREGVR